LTADAQSKALDKMRMQRPMAYVKYMLVLGSNKAHQADTLKQIAVKHENVIV